MLMRRSQIHTPHRTRPARRVRTARGRQEAPLTVLCSLTYQHMPTILVRRQPRTCVISFQMTPPCCSAVHRTRVQPSDTNARCAGFETIIDGLCQFMLHGSVGELTIGIFGAWGSGKSTLMRQLMWRMICHTAAEEYSLHHLEARQHAHVSALEQGAPATSEVTASTCRS